MLFCSALILINTMFFTIETTKFSELSSTVGYDKANLQQKIPNNCEFERPCSTDKDCGYKGKCMGGKITKVCTCFCSNFQKCKHDSECSLNGSCDTRHSFCNCNKAYRDLGLGSIGNVRRSFCNKKSCLNDDDCFGSICIHAGFCVCYKN